MTVASTTRKAGPYTGNGVATSFAFAFKVFSTADIAVIKANSVGTESTLVLDSDYSVTLNADQTANPGGSILYPISGSPMASPEKLAILGSVAYNQTTSLPNGGAYNASIVERALDRLTILIQQILEIANRGVRLAATAASNVSGSLPTPLANNLIGWNSDATALIDIPVASLATSVQANTWTVDKFNGTGAQTVFALTSAPGNVKALFASVGGVVQTPGVNFSLVGSTVTFLTGAPPAGTNNVVFQYGQAVQTIGTADLANTTGTLDGSKVSGAAPNITSLSAPALGAATATTQALGDSTTKVATTAFVSSTVNASGRVLQKLLSTDAGSSVSSTTPGNMSVANQSITPKSTSSKILVRCTFQGTITSLIGNNVSAGFQLRDATNATTILSRTFGNASGGGGVGLDAPVTLEFYVNNTVTTSRQFALWGNSGNVACIASAINCVWVLEEVQN